jgi:LysR family hydrogen peroxide-inducible transcriptional activator
MADSPLARLGSVTLTQLAYAVAVDTHRHFGAAAAACHVTQPTLSMQLRKLERALGVPLFDRSRTPVVPTTPGRTVLAQARVVLRAAEQLADVAAADDAALTGDVRLGVIPTLAPHLLPDVVALLGERHPGLALVVEERLTDEILARVEQGALDVGLVASAVASSALAERVLFREPFVGYVSATHRLAAARRLTPADLSLDDLWLLADGHCLRVQAVALCRRRRARPATRALGTHLESGNIDTLRRLVERGHGMTLLPALAAADLTDAGQRALLRPFARPVPGRDVRVVQRRARVGDPRIAALVEVVADVAASDRLRRAGVRPVTRRTADR